MLTPRRVFWLAAATGWTVLAVFVAGYLRGATTAEPEVGRWER